MLQKLTQVRAIVDQELGFVEAKATSPTSKDKLSLTAFLCIVEKRVVGMVLVESITTAFRLLPLSTRQNDYAPLREQTNGTNNHPTSSFAWERATEPCPAVLGIYQLWVHGKHRQCGIASALVDAARTHVVFGYHTVPLHHIAFSSPTESGVQFAMHYHQSHRSKGTEAKATAVDEPEVLVYDCG
jgi:ribosomal protein S18 acetylase RimI-like enzyme